VVGYSASTGEELWRQTELGGSLFPLAADATVVFVDHGWYYASYEAATGARLWSNPLPGRSPQTPFKATPILTRDRIYVAGRAGSYALRR
jgi:outer membrane protein assembly factor BamB